jgi:hypothetical protein
MCNAVSLSQYWQQLRSGKREPRAKGAPVPALLAVNPLKAETPEWNAQTYAAADTEMKPISDPTEQRKTLARLLAEFRPDQLTKPEKLMRSDSIAHHRQAKEEAR